MISIDNNSINQTLKQYLSQYRKVFTKSSFELFKWLIFGILYIEEVRSVKFIYDNFIKKYFCKSLNCFYYFLSYSKFSIENLMLCTLKIALSLISDEIKKHVTIFLTIDDTLQPKYGTKFDCYYHLFDHTNKNGNSYLDGHCFVSLVANIPLFYKNNKVKYLSIPLGYRIYDKQKTKLELASELIDSTMQVLTNYQVILLCDSWYPKGQVIETVKKYDNLNIIASVRCDTALYDLPPAPTGKKGRPKTHGEKLDVRMFDYHKEGNYFVATKKAITNLFKEAVNITVTATETVLFESVNVFISTIDSKDINIFRAYTVEGIDSTKEKLQLLPYFVYSIRWNIEVIFYQQKFFWSFGNYMVRNKPAIERYVNLLAVSFSFVQMLPFIAIKFSKYQFQSPQLIKHAVSEQLTQELILDTFVKKLENTKIYYLIRKAVNTFLGFDDVA